MTPKSFLLTPAVDAYLAAHNPPLTAVQQSLIEETRALGDVAVMQIAPEQGAFMVLLTSLLQPRFAVEVGTFTGYSALAVAAALPEGGRLLCCDVNEEWTAIARRHWAEAGVDSRIDLRIGPAIDTLAGLDPGTPVDLAFIDADKPSYTAYYEALLPMLSERGVILVDNVLWSGRVTDAGDTEESTEAIRSFNDHVAADPRSEAVMLPLADGLTLIRRV